MAKVDSLGTGLRNLLSPMTLLRPKIEDARQTINVRKMRECLDQVLPRCAHFPKAQLYAYLPDSSVLNSLFLELAECVKLPTLTQADERAFVQRGYDCLTRLREHVEQLLAMTSS